ncbi:hypothetical protein OL548_02420 [Lysinibacillus sp. MHQ-1]|nr:hypothetical protein OL548_02420 [Lysinibacillus sp. MHQ-1]
MSQQSIQRNHLSIKQWGAQAVAVAENIAKHLKPEEYEQLSKDPRESKLYWQLREELNELREVNGVLYAYTFAVPQEDKKSSIFSRWYASGRRRKCGGYRRGVCFYII